MVATQMLKTFACVSVAIPLAAFRPPSSGRLTCHSECAGEGKLLTLLSWSYWQESVSLQFPWKFPLLSFSILFLPPLFLVYSYSQWGGKPVGKGSVAAIFGFSFGVAVGGWEKFFIFSTELVIFATLFYMTKDIFV